MRIVVASAAVAFIALSIPLRPASAAMPVSVPVAVEPGGPVLVQADWNGHPNWHHHWRHEWRDHWHPDWHHHWHHRWDRPYGERY